VEDEDRPRRRRRDDDDEDAEDRPRRRRSRHEEDEEEDRPRRRRSRDDDEEDDERPRRRRSRDDEDDEDRPRRRRSRADEDEDDEDRPRRRRSRDDDDDYDRRRPAAKGKPDWGKVRLGLLLAFIGLCVFGGAFALEHIGVLILTIATLGAGGGAGLGNFVEILIKISVIVQMGGLVTLIVGLVFWIFVKSNKYGALGFAIASLAVSVGALGFGVFFRVMPLFQRMNFERAFLAMPYGPLLASFPFGDAIWPILTNVFHAAAWMMMALFMMALAKRLKDRYLASRAMTIVIVCGCLAGWDILWPLLGKIFMPSDPFQRGKFFVIITWLLYWIAVGLTGLVLTWLTLGVNNSRANVVQD
jgi:hypothetical protein